MTFPREQRQIDESNERDVDFWQEEKHVDDKAEEEWQEQSWSD